MKSHRPGERAWVVAISAITCIAILAIARVFLLIMVNLGAEVDAGLAYIVSALGVAIFGFVWYLGTRDDDNDDNESDDDGLPVIDQ